MIVVFGSINADLVARVPRLPRPGETLASYGLSILPGGKGANQAVAAAHAGAQVRLFGCVGADALAATALQGLRAAHVDISGVRTVQASTGVALIHVDDAGENCITIVAGANAHASAEQVPDDALAFGSTLLMQLEVPVEQVVALAVRARRRGARVVLNAAPATALPADLIGNADVLVVNEAEARTLFGPDRDADIRALCARVATPRRVVVVTRGADGALYAHDGCVGEQAAPRVDIVDTVGAGDAFTAALAVALDRGLRLEDAVRDAVAAGAQACTRAGAQRL